MGAYAAQLYEELQTMYAGGAQFAVFLASLVYLWFAEKTWRKPVVIPAAVLLAVLFNPVCYRHIWPKLAEYAFNRLLWTLPVAAVCAAAAVSLVRKCRPFWLKIVITAALLAAVTRIGPYMYIGEGNGAGSYRPAENAYHLQGAMTEVADELLKREARPHVVVSLAYSPYIRLYAPELRLYAGRYYYNVRTEAEKKMQAHLIAQPVDVGWIRNRMEEDGYRYLILVESDASPEETQEAGFDLLYTADDGVHTAYLYEIAK